VEDRLRIKEADILIEKNRLLSKIRSGKRNLKIGSLLKIYPGLTARSTIFWRSTKRRSRASTKTLNGKGKFSGKRSGQISKSFN